MIFKDRDSITKRTTSSTNRTSPVKKQSPEVPERHSYNPAMDVDSGKFEEEAKKLE